MRGTFASLTVLVVFAGMPGAARADWTLAASAAFRHDANVGNAQESYDKVRDYAASADLSLFRLVPLGGNFTLELGGTLSGEAYDKLDGLNNASIDGAVSIKKKWGLGAFAPWARAQFSVGRTDYKDDYRNATIYSASLDFGKRIDERWSLWGEYSFERRAATPGPELVPGLSSDVFSQDGNNLAATGEFLLSERISLTAGILWRHGDVVSTTLSPGYYIFSYSDAVAEDPAFGPDAYAYRLTGTTYGVKLGAEISITTHSVIGCGYQWLETHARGGNNYSDSMPEITWNYRF
jgi:hypothetical protein